MKRWLSGLFAALALFTLAACGSLVDLSEVPEGEQYQDTKIDLPTGEAPEDLEDPAAPEESPAQEDPPVQEESDPSAAPEKEGNASSDDQTSGPEALPENGTYTTKEDVALYIYTYGCLPENFITKKEAQNLGWPGGDLEPYAPGKCIGGSRFGNYEGLLPEAPGRTYTECDIDTLGAKSRGAKRLVFSNDGLIYYTEDHYESFELLYGDEDDG